MPGVKIKKIILNNQEVSYVFRKYRRSKNLKLIVKSDASIFVSAPWRFNEKKAEKFMREKSAWLLKRIEFFEKQNKQKLVKTTREDYIKRKEKARGLILQKIEKLNAYYNFKYGRVSIRNQKTRWGSCSKKGNLNFNYRLIYLPEKLFDYVIVHELCHLRQMNHSAKFWKLVAEVVPDYKIIKRELKKEGLLLF